jgi:peptidoglycan hydrolase CwlO-like protein
MKEAMMIAIKHITESDIDKIYDVNFYEGAGLYILHCQHRNETYIAFISTTVYTMLISYLDATYNDMDKLCKYIENQKDLTNQLGKCQALLKKYKEEINEYQSEIEKYKNELEKCLSEKNNNPNVVDKSLFLETISYLVSNNT